jgi:hypothetical protein
MIKRITFISNQKKEFLDVKNQGNKVIMDCSHLKNTSNFDIEIEFTSNIIAFRNFDYQWVDVKKNRIATEFSPKIIKLENGNFVQPNITEGIWETDARNPKMLYWKFNPEFSKPLTKYTGNSNAKIAVQANSQLYFLNQPALLFSENYALEFSRSKIPFSAVACFTDHCDFDTLENLVSQRLFFKSNNIKTTKGFFLNHFSKRGDNASYENNVSEIDLWKNDGHELCYHSLSQSIKSDEQSQLDFINFTPPYSDIPVWIDHGYQPYNFSLFEKNKISSKDFEMVLQKKNIKILWNYIDSGTTTNGVINQLNPNHFTLNSFYKGNKNGSKIKVAQAIIKNIVFHYRNEDKIISKYKATAQHFKKIIYQKKITIIPRFLIDFTILFKSIAGVLLFWNSNKNKPYKLSKYTPLLFRHKINEVETVVFQTVEMIDFSKSLSKKNIDVLINESGIFIAHTYFSDTISYHDGKLLTAKNEINPSVKENFNYLGLKIKEQKIWNPTLSEFYQYVNQLENVILDLDADGNIIALNADNLQYRKIQ